MNDGDDQNGRVLERSGSLVKEAEERIRKKERER